MKRAFFLSMLILCMLGSYAQSGTLPGKVLNTLNQKFPGVKDPEWKYKDKKYKLVFVYQKFKTEVTITEEGVWERTEKSLTGSGIPEVISKSISAKYPKGEFDKVKRIDKLDKPTVYKVSVLEGKYKFKLELDEKGDILLLEKTDSK